MHESHSDFMAELRDAVTTSAPLLVIGVLVLQLAFIASHLGEFPDLTPHRIPVADVAPDPGRRDITRAEREGFEPSDPVSQVNSLAVSPIRPLSHLSQELCSSTSGPCP